MDRQSSRSLDVSPPDFRSIFLHEFEHFGSRRISSNLLWFGRILFKKIARKSRLAVDRNSVVDDRRCRFGLNSNKKSEKSSKTFGNFHRKTKSSNVRQWRIDSFASHRRTSSTRDLQFVRKVVDSNKNLRRLSTRPWLDKIERIFGSAQTRRTFEVFLEFFGIFGSFMKKTSVIT